MKPLDMPEFAKMWMQLGIRYGRAVPAYQIEKYWQELLEYDFAEIEQAVSAYLVNPDRGQFFPHSADIVRQIRGDAQTQALRAWSKVTKAMRRVGSYQSLVFDDALIHAVIDDMGGWICLCQTNEHTLPSPAREFQQRYVSYVQHPPSVYPQMLLGRTNCQNSHSEPDPVIFGDANKALQIYQQGQSHALPTPQKLSLLPYLPTENSAAEPASTDNAPPPTEE